MIARSSEDSIESKHEEVGQEDGEQIRNEARVSGGASK